MPSVSGKHYLDWKDITEAVSSLAVSIESHNCQFERILGISRGGLIPATMLAHQLGIQEVGSLQLESYNGSKQDKIRMYPPIEPKAAGINNFQMWGAFASKWDKPTTLIVDDLHDSGASARWVREMFPEMCMATLFWKNHGARPVVGFPGIELPNKWITFPWEKDDTNGLG